MNLLTEALPEAVEIDGREYPIDTDFRACLKIIMAFEDPDLAPQEKTIVLLSNLYGDNIPVNTEKAVNLGMKFLDGGTERDKTNEDGPAMRLYSFSHDGNLIYSAFMQTHGIDLQTADMHWWKFLALFTDLGGETAFTNLIGLRRRIKEGKASKEEMREYRDHKELIDLPEEDNRTLEEKEKYAEFMRLVREGQERRKRGD